MFCYILWIQKYIFDACRQRSHNSGLICNQATALRLLQAIWCQSVCLSVCLFVCSLGRWSGHGSDATKGVTGVSTPSSEKLSSVRLKLVAGAYRSATLVNGQLNQFWLREKIHIKPSTRWTTRCAAAGLFGLPGHIFHKRSECSCWHI